MFSSNDILATCELIFYVPFFFLSIYVCFRHGFRRSSGWIYTLILCILRLAGAICQLLQQSDHSTSLIQATYTIESIGLSPLLLATLGMLSRFVDFVNARKTPTFTTKHFRLVQLVIMIGLILSIVGGTDTNAQPDGTISIPATSKAGIIIILVSYFAIVGIFALSILHISAVPSKERRVPFAVLIALPFILVRLIYSVLSVFIHNHTFSIIHGSVAVHAGMAVVEEFMVVATYVLLGFFVDRLTAETQGPIATRSSRNRDQQSGGRMGGGIGGRLGGRAGRGPGGRIIGRMGGRFQEPSQGVDLESQNTAYKTYARDLPPAEQQYGVTR